ncbi:hypothetical protein CTI12_AA201640 [Artemisia annua]|uniref:Glutamine dumper 3 n=1 Tax=Artemisia annua TaxID=35608 RepID=A0A2U1N8Z1_ARTAN|nr:hypothetical protein CTI12_AA201640 [Artemisia annua]
MTSIHSSSYTAPSPAISAQHSPWHSPVPYLFGGLAAMLGLIAFALLILACSYWKLSGNQDNRPVSDRDLESGEGDTKPDCNSRTPAVFEEKYLVIMAGQAKPTFLATPVSSRASSFGSSSCQSNSTMSTNDLSTSEDEEIGKEEGRNTENVNQLP